MHKHFALISRSYRPNSGIPKQSRVAGLLRLLRPLACAFDETAEIANWQIDWEVDRRQKLHEEKIPPQQASAERDAAGGMLHAKIGRSLTNRKEVSCQAAKCGNKGCKK